MGPPPLLRYRTLGDALRLGALVLLTLLGMAASAQVNLSISPGVMDVVCETGKPATLTFGVISEAAAPMRCSIGLTAVDVNSAGIPTPSPRNGLPDLSRSIVVSPKTFTIPKGKSTQALSARVTLPRGTVGGRYAMVACTAVTMAQPSSGGGAGFAIVPEVRAVIMVTAKGAGSSAILQPAAISIASGREKRGTARGGWSAEVTIRNTGNCHVALDGKMIIRNATKRIVDTGPFEGGLGLVFPGRERVFKAVGRKALPDGSYQGEMQMTSRGSTRAAGESVFFTVKDGAVTISGTQKPASSG